MEVAPLADLLHETAEHHGSYEAIAPPHDWWDWYAAYLNARQGGSGPDEADSVADATWRRSSTLPCRAADPVLAQTGGPAHAGRGLRADPRRPDRSEVLRRAVCA